MTATDRLLSDLAATLDGSRNARRLLDEIREDIRDAVQAERSRGLETAAAEDFVITRFGSPLELAASWNRDHAKRRRAARRNVALVLVAAATAGTLGVTQYASGKSPLAYAEQPPIPLKAPSGYRNYCDGMKRTKNYPCAAGGVPQALWRPLHLPVVASGAPCPTPTSHTVSSRTAPVLGTGPVFFTAGAYNPTDRTTMTAPYPAPAASLAAGTGWAVAKTTLVMKKIFSQPLVVRGNRIDGAGQLGFSGPIGRRPFTAIQFPATASAIDFGTYKAHGLNVWATSSGCYALQLDGKTFSRVVVFRIELTTA
jgi:hypothetical protein